jgi:Protein of unknown function (DUF3341)
MRHFVYAAFDREESVMSAVRELRSHGYTPDDVYAPYALHGLDRAAGLAPSRLGWVCAIAGFAGAALIGFFEVWSSATDWAINVGGKPFDSFPAFVPVIFEVGVLCGGLASVAALFLRSGLYPGKKPAFSFPHSTDDHFVVALEEKDGGFDKDVVRRLCERNGVVRIEEGDRG